MLWLLRTYKRWISPALPPSCRYVPTCSDYAAEAIERYGALRGGLMAAWRLLRCHPFVKGGYDPVVKPMHRTERDEWGTSYPFVNEYKPAVKVPTPTQELPSFARLDGRPPQPARIAPVGGPGRGRPSPHVMN